MNGQIEYTTYKHVFSISRVYSRFIDSIRDVHKSVYQAALDYSTL